MPDAPAAREALDAQIGARPNWPAASTWPAEEPAILAAHALALQGLPDLMLLIAPRQPVLADRTESAARARFGSEAVARRSRHEPITPRTQVDIADTIGEMNLWYRLAPIAFVGNSRPPGDDDGRMSGHNLFEPVALGALVLHGPQVDSFAEAYRALRNEGGAIAVTDAGSLASAILGAQDPRTRQPRLEAATRVLAANQAALGLFQAAVASLIPGSHREGPT